MRLPCHWGYSPNGLGHAVVLYQQGNKQLQESELPTGQVSWLFGLIKWTVKPKVYECVNIQIEPGLSYPSCERKLIKFADKGIEEAYIDFCTEVCSQIQFGGYPQPVQSDNMELDCIKTFDYGQSADWLLLLQLFEVGDMYWGDAGALYWYIHKDDLKAARFDRV